jgi:protein-L-isoaspartate(D-aspartate) O-methyltransferase
MTTVTTSADAHSPDELRAAMVEYIVTNRAAIPGQAALSERVLAVMRAVPRHEFVPEASLTQAYAEQAVITKRASDGAALSCASVPGVVAMMLDQLDVHPGNRILEIGAGTGYNAALLAELTGPDGQVTTVDIDPEVTAHARRALDATGYDHVRVVTADGQAGDPDHGPYDRIIVTVGPWDIPPAWRQQLTVGGRLVVPLRWRGQARGISFVHHDTALVSDAVELCGFVPMLGPGQDGERSGFLDPDEQVKLTWDVDQDINSTALLGILTQPHYEAWSSLSVAGDEPFDGIWLRLAAAETGTCRLTSDPAAVTAGLCDPAIPVRNPALVEGNSLAYLAIRRASDDTGRWELGAIGHGPTGADLSERICRQIRAWNSNRTSQPVIAAYPAGTPTARIGSGLIIDKPNTRLIVTY